MELDVAREELKAILSSEEYDRKIISRVAARLLV
jgi:hypothetical protein